MVALLKRLVINSGLKTKINVGYRRHLSYTGKQIDTLAVLRSLEAQGVPSKEAEAITSALTKVLNEGLENVSDASVSHVDMPKNVKKLDQDPPLPTFNRESLVRTFQNIDEENARLLANLYKMSSDFNTGVRQDADKIRATLKAGRNDIEARLREAKYDMAMIFTAEREASRPTFNRESLERHFLNIDNLNSKLLTNLDRMNSDFTGKFHQDVNEMVTSLEAGRYEFDAQLKAAKYDVVMICMAGLVWFTAFSFAIICPPKL